MADARVGQSRAKRPLEQNGNSTLAIQQKWRVEMAPEGANDEAYGGCRSYETSYVRSEQIGEGTYGQVYVATDLRDNSQVALKKVMDAQHFCACHSSLLVTLVAVCCCCPWLFRRQSRGRKTMSLLGFFEGQLHRAFITSELCKM